MKGSSQQEDITLNLCVPSNISTKYIKQKLIELNRERDKSTFIGRNINIPLSVTDKTSCNKSERI